jgi:putative intracellular protease/amidase
MKNGHGGKLDLVGSAAPHQGLPIDGAYLHDQQFATLFARGIRSSHDSIHVASNGSRILTDGILVDQRELSDRFDAIIVPGGNPDSIVEPPTVDSFTRRAYNSGAIIAGICAGN